MPTYGINEPSPEILFRNFLKEVFLDDEIASLIARRLAEKAPEERVGLVTSLCTTTNTHRTRWDALISKIK